MVPHFVFALVVFSLAFAQEQSGLALVNRRLNQLEKLLSQAESTIEQQDAVIHRLTTENDQQVITIQQLVEAASEHYQSISAQDVFIRELRDHAETMNSPIGFTAYAGDTRSYSDGDTLQFELVKSNHGLNYDPVTSSFYVASNGLYVFSTTIHVLESDTFAADIMHNSAEGEAVMQANAADSLQKDQATNVAIIECGLGDSITVSAKAAGGDLEGHPDHPLTTFSGFLLIRV